MTKKKLILTGVFVMLASFQIFWIHGWIQGHQQAVHSAQDGGVQDGGE